MHPRRTWDLRGARWVLLGLLVFDLLGAALVLDSLVDCKVAFVPCGP
jgi:hypothetical protein